MLSRVRSGEQSKFMRLNPRSHAAALTEKMSTARTVAQRHFGNWKLEL